MNRGQPKENDEGGAPSFRKRKARLFGFDSDQLIKSFFGSNALVSIFVLTLITIFLFKEGGGFVGGYQESLKDYRLSGLEYVDILKEERDAYTELNRYLNDLRGRWIKDLKAKGLSQAELRDKVMSPTAQSVFLDYTRFGGDLKRYVQDKTEKAIALRDKHVTNENLRESIASVRRQIEAVRGKSGSLSEQERSRFVLRLREFVGEADLARDRAAELRQLAAKLETGERVSPAERERFVRLLEREIEQTRKEIDPVDFDEAIAPVISGLDRLREINDELAAAIRGILPELDQLEFENPELDDRLDRFAELNRMFLERLPEYEERLANWDQDKPIPPMRSLIAFLTGKKWVTASDQQNWYGLLPLLSGSIMVSAIAMVFAVPLGIGAAIYVNQIAGRRERNFIKPYIEFISAIPSVVIGFFGVVVFGETVRRLSHQPFLDWLPFFPIDERLNAFTAGTLLALMAVPTIFTLSEDAINNVPRHFKEASMAMGATRLQTSIRVIVPVALSGMVSAIMLGFGRVIGETMVVLLVAGNRIRIPGFMEEGMGVFFQPVHTMTGIIAQEMGEVVHGSVHYRALFMVGIVLFLISLAINFGAQWVVRKFRKVES